LERLDVDRRGRPHLEDVRVAVVRRRCLSDGASSGRSKQSSGLAVAAAKPSVRYVAYRATETAVVIFAVAHHRLDPGSWDQR
jgi:hypothetical protein